MKFLLFGRDGQVGRALQPALAPLGEVVALGHAEADLSQPESLGPLIAQHRPDVIVNAAAYTAVDAAEDDRDRAWAINAGAVGVIGQAARTIGALVVHYSTVYVFDGTALDPQTEEQPTSPLGVYGASKLAGEVLLRDSGAGHLIFRTSWVYAARRANFAKTMLRLAKERDELRVIADQVGAPTSAELIADVTALALLRLAHDAGLRERVSGTYHLVASGETSWHRYAQFVIGEAIRLGAGLRATPERIAPIATSEYPLPAKRPANSRLANDKLQRTFGLVLPTWEYHVQRMIRELVDQGAV